MLLYSNIRGLHQASGELCRVCMEFQPSIFVYLKLTLMMTHLVAFVLPVIMWWLDETDLNMAVVYLF